MLDNRSVNFIGLLVVLMVFYAIGYAVASFMSLSIAPGVLGSVLLLITLLILPKLRANYYASTTILFAHFPLFVIPAAVGIMVSTAYFIQHPLLLLWIIFGSTLLSIIFTALVVRLMIGVRDE